MIYTTYMFTPAAKKLRKTTFSQGLAPHSNTLTSNSGPVSVFFVSGELTGKERDPETGLYYYGARYLDPRSSRWISADPAMWEGDYIPGPGKVPSDLGGMGGLFNYVNFHVYHYGGNSPVALVDPDGKAINFIIGGGIGFLSATAVEVGGRMMAGEGLGEAFINTFTSGQSLAIIGTSTAIGALTSGTSAIAVKATCGGLGMSVGRVTATTVGINAISGGVNAAGNDVARRAITGQGQNFQETLTVATRGAITSGGFSALAQTAIATDSAATSFGRVIQPDWAPQINAASQLGASAIDTGIGLQQGRSSNSPQQGTIPNRNVNTQQSPAGSFSSWNLRNSMP